MFVILLFLDMNNVIHFHVSLWWYFFALLEDGGMIALGKK